MSQIRKTHIGSIRTKEKDPQTIGIYIEPVPDHQGSRDFCKMLLQFAVNYALAIREHNNEVIISAGGAPFVSEGFPRCLQQEALLLQRSWIVMNKDRDPRCPSFCLVKRMAYHPGVLQQVEFGKPCEIKFAKTPTLCSA